MPVKIVNESEEPEVTQTEETRDPLITDDGDLTLEARAVSDFLTHADFGAVFEHPEAVPHVLTVGSAEDVTVEAAALAEKYSDMKHAGKSMKKKGKKGDDKGMDYDESKLYAGMTLPEGAAFHHSDTHEALLGLDRLPMEEADEDNEVPFELDNLAEKHVLQFLDGRLASQLVDEDDLVDMFAHYCEELAEAQRDEDAAPTMEAKLQLAALGHLFGIDEKGPFKRGSFKKMAKKKVGKAKVARMLGAMLNKGVIKRSKTAGGGHGGGDYQKDSGYKTGGKKAKKAAVDRFKKKNKSSRKKAALKAKTKLKDSIEVGDVSIYGLGVPVDEAFFEVGANAEAKLKTDESKDSKGGDEAKAGKVDEAIDHEETRSVTDVVRVVNAAGSQRTGSQLVAETIKLGKKAEKLDESGDSTGEAEKKKLDESQVGEGSKAGEEKPLSEGARLAAGMSIARRN